MKIKKNIYIVIGSHCRRSLLGTLDAHSFYHIYHHGGRFLCDEFRENDFSHTKLINSVAIFFRAHTHPSFALSSVGDKCAFPFSTSG